MSELKERVEERKDKAKKRVESGLQIATEKHKDRLQACEALYRERTGERMPEYLGATLGHALENTVYEAKKQASNRGVATEALTTSDLGQFIRHGFDLISSIIPTSVLDEVATIQPMERKNGRVFYLDAIYDSDKGSISQGDEIFDAKNPVRNINTGGTYTTQQNIDEPFATGDGSQTSFTRTLRNFPVIQSDNGADPVLTVTDGTETFTDQGDGTLDGDAGGSGTVDYETGEVTVNFNSAPSNNQSITASYEHSFDENPASTPRVSFNIEEEDVTAEKRTLATNWLLDTEFELEQHHGRQATEELVSIMAGLVRNEIDNMVLNDIQQNAQASNYNPFDADATTYRISQNDRNEDFINQISNERSQIENNSARGTANIMLCGTNVSNFVETLDDFELENGLEDRDVNGPHVRGEWKGLKIIKVPDYQDDEYVLGYKGERWLDAAYAWMPYTPLLVSSPYPVGDGEYERYMYTRNAKSMLRSNAFLRNTINNLT